MKKAYIITLFIITVAAGTVFAETSCPTLNTSNIGEAACATKDSPLTTGALAAVKFHAVTPCPSGILRKKIQGLFKGQKDYKPTEVEITAGKATCTYNIDDTWKAALGANSNELIFEVSLLTRAHANIWSGQPGAKCPALTVSLIDSITETHMFERVAQKDIEFAYTTTGLGSLGGKIRSFVSKKPTSSTKAGIVALTKPFEVDCSYKIHLGGDPNGQEIKIKGVQAKK